MPPTDATMIPRSMTPARTGSISSSSSQNLSNPTTAEELLARIDRLTLDGDTQGVRELLIGHPTAFARGESRPWVITPESRLDLQALFTDLDPAILLPPMRLQGFEWHGVDMCSALLCHPGLRDLTLHECALGDAAWAQAAEHGQRSFAVHPSGLQRLAFTFNPPDASALAAEDVISSSAMAAWTSQLHQLQDLTLSGFHNHASPYHMSYGHVFLGLQNTRLQRLTLLGFLPMAFCSPRTHEALPAVVPGTAASFHLSMQGWIWPPRTHASVDTTTQAMVRQLVASGSGHLTVELQDMDEAANVALWVGQGLGARSDDFSLRLDCPEDASRQDAVPVSHNNAALDQLALGAQAGSHHLCGLHLQLSDMSRVPTSVEGLINDAARLQTVTVVVAANPSGFSSTHGAHRLDSALTGLLQPLASLSELEIRSPHAMVALWDLKESMTARDADYV